MTYLFSVLLMLEAKESKVDCRIDRSALLVAILP